MLFYQRQESEHQANVEEKETGQDQACSQDADIDMLHDGVWERKRTSSVYPFMREWQQEFAKITLILTWMSEPPVWKVWLGYVLFYIYQLEVFSVVCSETKTKPITYQVDYSAKP